MCTCECERVARREKSHSDRDRGGGQWGGLVRMGRPGIPAVQANSVRGCAGAGELGKEQPVADRWVEAVRRRLSIAGQIVFVGPAR
jgi:hypothetical protein